MILPVPDSFDGPMQTLTKERFRAVGVTQHDFLRRTAGTAENELMENSRHVETALSHAVPRRAELVNASRPINRFPPELLFQVFDFVAGRRIILAHLVVRNWGVCAFGSPVPSKVAGFAVAETVMHRVVSFEVDFCARVHEPFTCLTYAVAPALERLYVTIPPHSAMSTPRALGMLFGGGMPSLRELVLERCLPWPNCISQSITSLTLINSSDLGPCDNLLSVLESCANVEVLTLLNAIPNESSSTPGPSSDLPVRLDCLRELYVHSVSVGIYGISSFLSRLSFPRLVTGGAYLAILGWGIGDFGAFTSHVTRMFPRLLTGLSVAEDTLGSRAPLRLKGVVDGEVVFSVPSTRALGLGSLSLTNVNTLTLGPSRGWSAALRDSARNKYLVDGDSAWEKLFTSLPALETLVLCKTALSPPLDAICRLGRIPNVPDRLPHLRYLHLDVCELERCPDDGSELPHVALRRFLQHRARIEYPIVSVKCYCGPVSLSKETVAELRALVPSFECVATSLITQVIVPRRVGETMDSARYRSFGEPALTRNRSSSADAPAFAS
ncbi:hypothetical protein EDB87DRAFT_1690435 [Lactarius vividus]|nr:hypothetical protein EDB87DRAFT_1690435 [Lactarius vividus]